MPSHSEITLGIYSIDTYNTDFTGEAGTAKDTFALHNVCFSPHEFAVAAILLDKPLLEQLLSCKL